MSDMDQTPIIGRLRRWHPRHCASRRPTAVMPNGYPCNCGHEDAAAEIESLRARLDSQEDVGWYWCMSHRMVMPDDSIWCGSDATESALPCLVVGPLVTDPDRNLRPSSNGSSAEVAE